MEERSPEGRSRNRIANMLVYLCGCRKRMKKTRPGATVIGESGKMPWSLIQSGKKNPKI